MTIKKKLVKGAIEENDKVIDFSWLISVYQLNNNNNNNKNILKKLPRTNQIQIKNGNLFSSIHPRATKKKIIKRQRHHIKRNFDG